MGVDVIKGRFPIGGWVGPSAAGGGSPSFLEDRYFKLLHDSGINLMYGNTEHNGSPDVMKGLELCDKYGINYLVNDSRYRSEKFSEKEGIEAYEKYAVHPSFAGIAVHDEPFLKDMESLRLAKTRHKKVFSKTHFHSNLFPIYCDSAGVTMRDTHENSSYEEYVYYVEKYIECVNPDHLSYDYYPFQGEYGKWNGEYFENLEFIRAYAEKLNIPYWCFIQVTAPNRVWRNTEESEIRWILLTSLAFGAKGINYFTFCTPVDPGAENFRDAMLDRKGNPTPSYYYVKNVNVRAKKLGEMLLKARHKGVILPLKSDHPIKSAVSVRGSGELTGTEGDEIMTGLFEKNGSMYLAVNTDFCSEHECVLHFKRKVKLTDVESGRIYEGKTVTVTLPAADGVLLKKIK